MGNGHMCLIICREKGGSSKESDKVITTVITTMLRIV